MSVVRCVHNGDNGCYCKVCLAARGFQFLYMMYKEWGFAIHINNIPNPLHHSYIPFPSAECVSFTNSLFIYNGVQGGWGAMHSGGLQLKLSDQKLVKLGQRWV